MNYEKIKKQINNYISKHSVKKNRYYLCRYRQILKNEYRCQQMKLCSKFRASQFYNKPMMMTDYTRQLCLLIEKYRPVLSMIDSIEKKL